jgi:excisionase family DNA binding protein
MWHAPRNLAEDEVRAANEAPVRLHTIPETAELLGDVSKMHVYRLIAAGELRAVDIAERGTRSKTRVRSDDLAAYIERRTRSRATTA